MDSRLDFWIVLINWKDFSLILENWNISARFFAHFSFLQVLLCTKGVINNYYRAQILWILVYTLITNNSSQVKVCEYLLGDANSVRGRAVNSHVKTVIPTCDRVVRNLEVEFTCEFWLCKVTHTLNSKNAKNKHFF